MIIAFSKLRIITVCHRTKGKSSGITILRV